MQRVRGSNLGRSDLLFGSNQNDDERIVTVRGDVSEYDVGSGRSTMIDRRSYPSVLVNSWCPMDSAYSLGRQPTRLALRVGRQTSERLESPPPGTVECIHQWGAFRDKRAPTRDERVAGATRRYV